MAAPKADAEDAPSVPRVHLDLVLDMDLGEAQGILVSLKDGATCHLGATQTAKA